MSDQLQLTTHELWNDGRAMTLTATKTNPTTLRLSWDLPVNPTVYNGAIVLLSEARFTANNFPIDGTRYQASSNWAAPASNIDGSQVVAAFYGFFGDNIQQTYVDVTNIDPNKLYYASIHACSNILQYFTTGNQSYPLESSRIEGKSETYAGSIPTAEVPPENPVNGQIYFDSTSNNVLVWNNALSAWVKSTQNTVPIGDRPPIQRNQLFFNTTDQKLRYFNGSAWVDCDATNTLVKLAASWAPFNSASWAVMYPTAPVVGDFIYLQLAAATATTSTYALQFYTLGSWFDTTPDLVHVYTAAGNWESIAPSTFTGSATNPVIPNVGDFFYQSITRDLLVWNGSDWSKADTANEGTPTSDKVGVGSDGSYAERLRLIKILKNQLGYPSVCTELNEDQFNVAIDNALDEFRRRADNAYSHRHIAFTLVRGQSTYYLNDPRDQTDKIVNVMKIHRIGQLGISSISAENGLYAQAFFNQLYQGSNVDVLSIHLMAQLAETYEKIFAGNLVFTWDEATRNLMILRNIALAQERVILEVVMERTEQELLLDRWAKQWLQGWAQSELWEMLGEIRSKYTSALPGANGGITLNGESLLQRSVEQQTELLRQITDYEVGNGGINFGNTAFYIG